MLILKRPMQLQSVSGITMYSDKLGEKIIANYQLIGMEITSADFLHMMAQAPEQFLNTAYYGVLTVENPIHANNQIKLELINQLVNRLMLCFSSDFTYQDEVFVVSVLQKIGIFDIKEFMQQIHHHMDHNMLLTKLFNFYFSHKKQIQETVHFVQTNLQQCDQRFYETGLKNTWNKEYQFAYYLHNQIFCRLMTTECNRIIDSYYCQLDKGKTTVQGVREAVWTEQADVLELSKFREMMFWQTNPTVWQNDIYYERKHFAHGALTEEKVVQRIVAAILENMIQKLHGVCQQCEKNIISKIQWRDYTQTFCQSASDVLERFWYYQSKQTIEMHRYESYIKGMFVLAQDEWKLTQVLKDFTIVHNHIDWEEGASEVVLSMWENQNLQKQLSGRIQLEERLAAQNYLWDMHLEEQQEYLSELNKFQETKNQWIQLKNRFIGRWKNNENIFQSDRVNSIEHLAQLEQNNENPFQRQKLEHVLPVDKQEVHGQQSNIQPQETQHYLDMLQSQTIQQDIDVLLKEAMQNNINIPISQEMQNNIDILQRQETQQYEIKDILQEKGVHEQQSYTTLDYLQNKRESSYNYMDEFLYKYEQLISEQEIPFSENKRLLDEVNEHNLQMKHLLDSADAASANRDTLKRVIIDHKRARQSALHALENPQEALCEIYAYATAIEEDLPPEIAKIFRVTDENTQLFYRQLLGYQSIGLPREQNSIQENKIFNIDSIKTKTQHLTKKESAIGHVRADLSAEKSFDTYNVKENTINIKYSASEIETMLRQIVECERSIYQEQILQQHIDATFFADKVFLENRNLSENQIIADNQTIIESVENRNLSENQTTIDNQIIIESVENQNLSDNQTTIDNQTIIESVENRNLSENQTTIDNQTIIKLLENRNLSENRTIMENKTFIESLENKVFIENGEWKGIDFAYRQEQQMTEHLEPLENRFFETSDYTQQRKGLHSDLQKQLEQLKQQQIEQRQLIQQQLQDIRQKLLRESEEQFAQIINYSLKTQVHTISDIVYHELERKLKNEQRRRGY